ncbi:MAG: adenine phosphoribosyltransferase [Deltaproteobacteria bacterium]|nr:adenine phosphoribosyltransferase [Deltaproteobacteria bacterium]
MDRIREAIRDVPDFPKPGIIFKDITPLLASPEAFGDVIDILEQRYTGKGISKIVAIESRGFLFGAALADRLKIGMVPVRKPGKLPYRKIRHEYKLEYGSDAVEIHEDAVLRGEKVVIIDDLLATGGTAAAAISLVQELGGVVMEAAFVIELAFLNGRAKLSPVQVFSVLEYD